MNKLAIRARPPTYVIYGLAIALFFGIALFVRVYFPYDNVFAGDWVRFQLNDPWFSMRNIENLVQHFPHRSLFDPYGAYPAGSYVGTAPFFDLLIAFFAWILGAGSPSKGVIETVAAYLPAIMGALVTIPIYFIAKELFDRKTGILATALIAILPGPFLLRTLLGFTDHHAAEILFSTLAILFLILALKNAKQRNVSLGSVWRGDWGTLRKPLTYSLLAGIALGLYLLSWRSGAFFVSIVLVFAIIQYVIDHLRGRSTDYLCLVGVPALLITLLMIVPFWRGYSLWNLQLASVLLGMLAFLALSASSSFMTRRKMQRAFYPIVVVIFAGIAVAILHLVDPSLLSLIKDKLRLTFNPSEGGTIFEMRGLSLSAAWDYFGPAFFISLASLLTLLYVTLKEGAADKSLLLVWSVITLVAAFGQQRLAYYFAINVALLTAYLSWRILDLARLRRGAERSEIEKPRGNTILQVEEQKPRLTRKARRRKEKSRKRRQEDLHTSSFNLRYVYRFVTLIVLLTALFYPNIVNAIDWANGFRGPDQDWHEALVWMRANTTEPFSDPQLYYEKFEKPIAGKKFDYPESAYGVMSWWDYGYWITYIAHRIPNANPGGFGSGNAGVFFTTQDESSASDLLDKLGSKYIIIDYRMAIPQTDPESGPRSYFPAMAKWAGKDVHNFFETYYVRKGSRFEPVLLYYPAFYQSMSTRLYIFGGEEVIPSDSTWVISFTEKTDKSGAKYKVIVEQQRFATYQEAEDYVALKGTSNYLLVGNSPLYSPVPLDRLEHYELRYKSSTPVVSFDGNIISRVEIFEYLP